MTERHRTAALVLVVGLVATIAEAQSVAVGAFRGELGSDATVGALRGSVPPDAPVGSLTGPLPSGASTGAVRGLAGTPGFFPAGTLSGSIPTGAAVGVLQGAVPADAATGELTPPVPPGLSFGPPTQQDLARGLEALAEVHLTDRSFAAAESALDRSLALHEQALGPGHPGVADTLESHARLLRRYDREATATALEDRARQIREQLERPPRRGR